MSRSSILSFESLQGFRLRVPWTALAVLAGLAADRSRRARRARTQTHARRQPAGRDVLHGRRSSAALSFSARGLPRQFPHSPGNCSGASLMTKCTGRRILDRQSRTWRWRAVFESLTLYERNEAQLKSAKLVVLNVDEWHLSSGPKMSNSLYEIEAPLLERLRLPPDQRARLLPRRASRHVPGGNPVAAQIFFSGAKSRDVQSLMVDANNNQVVARGVATHEHLTTLEDQMALFLRTTSTSTTCWPGTCANWPRQGERRPVRPARTAQSPGLSICRRRRAP